jgi:aminoglycoside phosphotransferase (APT) family kinase protein
MFLACLGGDEGQAPKGPIRATTVVRHLLSHGLLSYTDLLNGHIEVTRTVRRNLNFKVVVESGGSSYLVKWPSGGDTWSSLAREAKIYEVLSVSRLASDGLRWPRIHDFDPSQHVLVLELIDAAVDLGVHHNASNRTPVVLARRLGQALAILHSRSSGLVASAPASVPHWALDIHQPHLSRLADLPAAVIEAIAVIQSSAELTSSLDALRAGWLATTLIHGDIRWENCVAYPSGGRTARLDRVALVDWEQAGVGDPLWDVGCALAEYLSSWVASTPIAPWSSLERAVARATKPVERMRPAMRALWQAYARESGFGEQPDAYVLKATRMVGGSLIKTAIEQLYSATRLTATALALIQLGANIMARPDEAAIHLMGIRPES